MTRDPLPPTVEALLARAEAGARSRLGADVEGLGRTASELLRSPWARKHPRLVLGGAVVGGVLAGTLLLRVARSPRRVLRLACRIGPLFGAGAGLSRVRI